MEETEKPRRHFIDFERAEDGRRSISVMIAGRKCHSCREADTEEAVLSSKPEVHIERIAKHCSATDDYLLPDMPLKEAIYRVVLAGRNEPSTAEEISKNLSMQWATSASTRDLSPAVIGRLLDHSESYLIGWLPEPEPEPEPEEVETVEAKPGAEQSADAVGVATEDSSAESDDQSDAAGGA